MAHVMITTLAQEPEKDLNEIIARVKGKPVEKSQQTPVTIGDFAIGMFSVPTTSNQSANSISQKSNTSKSGYSRQSTASSSSAVNRRSAGRRGRQAATNAWQNPVPGSGRPGPRPLPIVTRHMSNPSNTGVTSNSGMPSPASFYTFQLWNNASPTPILSKKEDFASVAAAGVVPTQPSTHSGQAATPGSPASAPNDPAKAPGYKAGIGSAYPQSRTDLAPVGSSLPFPGPVGNPEHPDDFQYNSGDPMSTSSGMSGLPGLPNPAGEVGHMSPHLPYPGPLPPSGFPNQHQPFFHQQPVYPPVPGSLVDQKEEYSTPHQPMTLPEIKSTLNPNAPDFQITGSGGSGPGGMTNGYPPQMGDMRNGGEGNILNFNSRAGGERGGVEEPGGNSSGVDAGMTDMLPGSYWELVQAYMREISNLPPEMLQQLGMEVFSNLDQDTKAYYSNLHPLNLQTNGWPESPDPWRTSAPDPPEGQVHLVYPDAGLGMGPGPGGPGHMYSYMPGPSLPRNVSPMPGQHRPNSAPYMPDSVPTTPMRPSNIESPMSPCTPPLSEKNQTFSDRKVLRLIGGDNKLPFNKTLGLGGSGDLNGIWSSTETTNGRMPATPPQTTATASDCNMTYTLSQENSASVSDSIEFFPEAFPRPSMDSSGDPTLQNPQVMMQSMYPNGLHYNLPNMFVGSRGSSGGEGMGEGSMAMWNQAVKAGPNDAGDSEAWWLNWSYSDI